MPPSLYEMLVHPFATLKRIQGLDRLPDRRVSRHPLRPGDSSDPIRAANNNRLQSLYRALGVYALEESRIELYQNYREMDTDPMVSSVLDAFGEDAGQLDPEHRRIVWVEATNSEISNIVLSTMDRLRVEHWAFPVMRTLARDGDVFFHNATARGDGIVAIRPYEPWAVARIEDDIGRLIGFAPSDEMGCPTRIDTNAAQPYQALHFRLPSRELTSSYGSSSSFLWGSRVTWRELQLMEDQIVIQRLLRRPDRVMVLMDATGMSHDDAWMSIREWERRLHREWYLNPTSQEFLSQGVPLDMAKDLVLPLGPNNQTKVENFPATNQNDLLRDLDLMLAKFAAGIGFPLGFIGRGDPGSYQGGQSLSRQSQPFAKRAFRLQRAFLEELTRMCMIDLAYRNLNPYSTQNEFTLCMASVAPIVEIERAEVVQLRMDRMERAITFGTTAGLNMNVWIPYVLEKYGGLPRDLIQKIYVGQDTKDTGIDQAGGTGALGSASPPGGPGANFSEHRVRKNGTGRVTSLPEARRALDEAEKFISALIPEVEGDPGVRSATIKLSGIDETLLPLHEDRTATRFKSTALTAAISPAIDARMMSMGALGKFDEARTARSRNRVSVIRAIAGALPSEEG
jgi:hypothetical protein